jgi:glycosyltransferase involved in cell wall biosynthesis
MERRQMTIGINGSMMDEKPSGVGVYSFNIINSLYSLYSPTLAKPFTVFTPTRNFLRKEISIVKLSWLLQSSRYGKAAAFFRFCWNTFYYHFQARKFDVLISPSTHGSFLLKNQVITIHDLLSLRYKNISWHQRIYFRYLLPGLTRRARLIITVSESTKTDIVRFLKCDPAKVKVIHNGYDDNRYYLSVDKDQLMESVYGLKNYILAVGPTYPHKNFETLLDSYHALPLAIREKHSLVVVGGRKKYISHLKQCVASLGLQKQVHFLGYLPLEQMPALYREALTLVFPSLYEGFGIPLLEAMASGCPVISSSTSSMPEVCDDAACYFDPLDKKALTAAMARMISDEKYRKELKHKGLIRSREFSWRKTAETLKKIIESNFQTSKI